LVGTNPEAVYGVVRGDSRIELTGEVKDAMAEIAKAQLSVVPLLTGSGTHFKILEAWAAGTAVVSTTLGGEGLSQNLRIADRADAFVRAVSELLTDSGERRRFEDAGRTSYESSFHRRAGWDVLDTQGPGRHLVS
jgi:polysaccharide biosynthesis protein PslH